MSDLIPSGGSGSMPGGRQEGWVFHKGGLVRKTGVKLLQKGELVIPAKKAKRILARKSKRQ